MTPFEQKTLDLKRLIESRVKETGFYKWETCDKPYSGWDELEHHASHSLQRNGIDGIIITHSVNWGVTDWFANIK